MIVSQFFASDERIKAVRQMIMSGTVEQRQKALDLLLPYQRSDFEGIFRAMDGNGSLLCSVHYWLTFNLSEMYFE